MKLIVERLTDEQIDDLMKMLFEVAKNKQWKTLSFWIDLDFAGKEK